MASVRGYALGQVPAQPANGPETVQQARDRLHAMIACGEQDLEIEAYVVVDGERIPLAEYAVRSIAMKAERLSRRGRSSSTVGDLKAAFLAMTAEQQALPLKVVVPPTKGVRDREMFAHASLYQEHGYRIIRGIPPAKAAKHTPHGYNDIKTVADMLDRIADQYSPRKPWNQQLPPSPVDEASLVLLRINSEETTDSLRPFHVSRIEIRDDAVVLRYLDETVRSV